MKTKMLSFVLATFILLVCFVSNGCSCGRYERPRGSIWQSSNPEMWFAFNVDGTTEGELIHNGEVIKLYVDNRPAWNGIGGLNFCNYFTDELLLGTYGSYTSSIKIVADVRTNNLLDFSEEQIVFIRVN